MVETQDISEEKNFYVLKYFFPFLFTYRLWKTNNFQEQENTVCQNRPGKFHNCLKWKHSCLIYKQSAHSQTSVEVENLYMMVDMQVHSQYNV